MDLHRAGKEPEWATTPDDEKNIFQKIAANTGGVVTPGNVVSVLGLGLNSYGLRELERGNTRKGIAVMAVGAICDKIDGAVANSTKTKSPIGEKVDVVTDKIKIATTLPALHRLGILPRATGAVLAAQNIINTVATGIATYRGAEIHSSYAGKVNTVAQWTTIAMHGVAFAAREQQSPDIGRGFDIAGNTNLVLATAIGVQASYGYFREAFASVDQQ